MNEADVIGIIREYLDTLFPKECKCCGRHFSTLAEYILATTHLEKPISYDVELGDWQPITPIGTFSMANCSCGSTLTLSSEGMDLITLSQLMNWAREETQIRGIGMRDLLEDLRTKIDLVVLHDGAVMP